MDVPLRKLAQHIREYGVIITIIDSFVHIIRKMKKMYYQKKVGKKSVQAGTPLRVNYESNINKKTHLGDNVNFNVMSIVGEGEVTIGDNFHSGTDCLIITQNHNYDTGDAIPYDNTYIYKKVVIGDNVWLGSRVTILPGITIEEGAIIQAGSTVTSDIPKGAIAGGHPAKIFDRRNMDHYNKHKSEGNFH